MRTLLTWLSLAALLLPLQLASRFALLEKGGDELPPSERDRPPTLDASRARALFLNYATFAAALVWVEALIYNGDFVVARNQGYQPAHYFEHAGTVAALDPDFRQVYEWLNSTYIASRGASVSHADLMRASDFLDRGIAQNPTDAAMLFSAGMNFIGYSARHGARDRIVQIERAVDYLERCAKLAGCPQNASSVIAYLHKRRRQLEAELGGESLDPKAERESLRELYLELLRQTIDEAERERLIESLRDLGIGEAELARAGADDVRTLQAAYEAHMTFLPLDLWTLIVYPVDDPLVDEMHPAISDEDTRERDDDGSAPR